MAAVARVSLAPLRQYCAPPLAGPQHFRLQNFPGCFQRKKLQRAAACTQARLQQPTIRASSSSKAARVASASSAAQTEILKAELAASLAGSEANLTPESISIIEKLETLNPNPNAVERKDLWSGHFRLLNSSMQGVLYPGCQATLGRATFNAFKPVDLMLEFEQVYNDVLTRGVDNYDVIIPFTVVPGQEEARLDAESPLRGVLFNQASVTPSSEGEARLDVVFKGASLRPRDADVDLSRWLELFKGEGKNEAMRQDGVCAVELPPAKGWLDLTYLDEDLRITRGHFGTIVVVARLESPVVL